MLQCVVREAVQMIPQLLLAKVAKWTCRQSHDLDIGPDRFFWPGVVVTHLRIVDKLRKQVDPAHFRSLSQRSSQLDDVFGLSACIRVASELEILTAHQTVDTDQCDVKAVFVSG